MIIALFFCLFLPYASQAIEIVAAENFYGQVSQEIGGEQVHVVSILSNPNQDPHLFSTSAATARAVAEADLIIYNGIHYDPWMKNLIEANANKKAVIIVADLMGKKTGDDPHIWYDPQTMLTLASELAKKMGALDPSHQNDFNERLKSFKSSYQSLLDKIAEFKKLYSGIAVIATESVFNYMAEAIGLKMEGLRFQLSILNDTTPSAKDIIEFEGRLKKRQVKVLIYNNQVSNSLTTRLKELAQKMRIPVVGVSETEPQGKTYISWMVSQLEALERGFIERD